MMGSTRSNVLPTTGDIPLPASPLGGTRSHLVEMRRVHRTNSPQPAAKIEDYAVKEQLSRILGSVFFRNSDRYTGLLHYVVDTALREDYALLKERLIGVNVFGRDPSYDTVKDNVVRIAAAEVRGRLVRYYALSEHRSELRIILSPGSYVPQFAWPELAQQHRPAEDEESVLHKFWSPLVECVEPVLIVLGPSAVAKLKQPLRGSPDATDGQRHSSEQITLSDALTLSRIVSYLESRGKEYRVEMQDFVRFRDLRNGPAVLLGGLNNQWTMSFAEHLRFAFKSNRGCTRTWICDKKAPARQAWIQDWAQSSAAITEDHAIVARVLMSATGQPIVIAGGHTAYGTAAAGEFITNNFYLNLIIAEESADWNSMNLELVIAATVVRGVSGPPRISARYLW
jgi:hypothetical protein